MAILEGLLLLFDTQQGTPKWRQRKLTCMNQRKNSAPARLPRNQVSALGENEGGEKGTRKSEIGNWQIGIAKPEPVTKQHGWSIWYNENKTLCIHQDVMIFSKGTALGRGDGFKAANSIYL